MILIPAIDLLEGAAVRLAQGDRSRATVYESDPASLVDRFADAGCTRIHVVDLDGAFEGKPAQTKVLGSLAGRAHGRGVKLQVGGGIRDAATVESLLDEGVDAVVIGTMAVRDPEQAAALCRRFADRIIVAVDAKGGKVAIAGWQEDSGIDVETLAADAQRWGAAALLHTDVARDGMQVGPAVEATAALQAKVSIPVYASGGVGTIEHLRACAQAGIRGVVFGRAIYEGAFTLEEALATC